MMDQRWPFRLLLGLVLAMAIVLETAHGRVASADIRSKSSISTEAIGVLSQVNDEAQPAESQPLHLTFALQTASQEAVADFVNSLTDPSSPNYHKWITAQEFGQKFGASNGAIAAVTKYLKNSGFSNVTLWPDRQFISADTTRQKAEEAFDINIHGYYRSTSEVARGLAPTFFAPDHEPSIDSSVAPFVAGVLGLSNAAARRAFASQVKSSPNVSENGYLDPIDLANVYGDTTLHNLGYEGQGEIIAIYSPTAFQQSDINTFMTANKIASAAVNVIPVTDSSGTGNTSLVNQDEADVDIETVLGIAPDATVDVYEAPNDGGFEIFNAVEATNPVPNVLSMSWGVQEDSVTSFYVQSYETLRATMAAEGISIFVASDDSGPYDPSKSTPTLSVSVDASSAYVTGVGGTELSPLVNDAWSGEKAWTYNDGTTDAGNGSGGGLSIYVPEPYWQTGPGVNNSSSNGFRQVPDVAALASTPYYDIYSNGIWGGYYGTSCSTPFWAASMALVGQDLGTRLGNINPALYAIGAEASNPFHDITSGNDSLYYCTPGWDFVTGWGSVDFGKLAVALGALPPSILSFTPTWGTPGTAVTITGTSIGQSTNAEFGGVSGTVTSSSQTSVIADVPVGAVTGPITLVTGQGAVTTSSNFTVIPFLVVDSPTTVSINEGSANGTIVDLYHSSLYTGPVTLSVSGLPAGVTSTFSPTVIYSSASGGQATESVLLFNVGQTAAPGTYPLVISGTNGTTVDTAAFSLVVGANAILTSIGISPASATLSTGSTEQFAATALDQFGNAYSPQPSSFTWTASAGTVTSGGLFTAPSSGTSAIVTATADSLSGSAAITIGQPKLQSFALAAAPSAVTVNQGSSGTSSISLTGANGFTGSSSLTVSGLPSGVTASFSPASVVAGTPSTITFTIQPTAAVGTATVTVAGVSGSLTSNVTIALTVAAKAILTTISVSPTMASVVDGGTQKFTATGDDQNGNVLATQPTFTWTATRGSVGSSGLYTAPTTIGSDTVAASNGAIKTRVTVTVTAPPIVSSLAISPGTVTGGTTATGTITLNQAPTTSAITVVVSSSNIAVATAPTTVVIPVGSISSTFILATYTVSTPSSVTITATTGSSPQAATVTITAVAVPNAPTGLRTVPSTSSVMLYWNTSSGATSYNIYRSSTSGGEGTTPVVIKAATSADGTYDVSYSNTGLAANTTYYYQVTAVNTFGESPKSAETSATTGKLRLLGPAGLAETTSNGQVTLKWTAVAGATSYNIMRSLVGGSTDVIATGVLSTTYTDTTSVHGVTYTYSVAGVNTASEGYSSSVTAMP
jgi:hypothetical protein